MGDWMPFHGLMCAGLYFSSGWCLSVLKWDSAPVDPPAFSQVWAIAPDGGSDCYIDPPAASCVFEYYHNFDRVTGAEIDVEWSTPKRLTTRVRGENVSLDLEVVLGSSFLVDAANALLKTGARRILRSRGTTDAGRVYMHQPHRLAPVRTARASLNGKILGSLTRPPEAFRIGGSAAPDTPMISFCTHFLEPYPGAMHAAGS